MSNSSSQDNKNYEHNVFRGISIRPKQEELVCQFIDMLDVSDHTLQALILDIRKFAKWFTSANCEPWDGSLFISAECFTTTFYSPIWQSYMPANSPSLCLLVIIH